MGSFPRYIDLTTLLYNLLPKLANAKWFGNLQINVFEVMGSRPYFLINLFAFSAEEASIEPYGNVHFLVESTGDVLWVPPAHFKVKLSNLFLVMVAVVYGL